MADLTPRLMAESERYLSLLEKLGKKLVDTLDVDVNEAGTPTRDWCRTATNYGTGIRGMLAEQRERAKLQLLAGKQDMLSDEQYQAELRALAVESLGDLPADVIQAELDKRGLKVEPVGDDE